MRSYYPFELLFSVGASRDIMTALNRFQVYRPLIVSDPGVAAAGIVSKILTHLGEDIEAIVFAETSENPHAGDVDKALAMYIGNECDGVIALGGGSSIDCAKSVALLATHEGPLATYAVDAETPRHIRSNVATLVAIPTTAGTGSEVGRGVGISDFPGAPKKVIYSEYLIPKVTICDPELTLTMPPSVTASTGMDALSHAIEGYLSTVVHPIADLMALDAIRRITRSICNAVSDGSDIEARSDMLMGSVMAGMAMHKGLGPAHAMGVPLDSLNLRHGVLMAILLPYSVGFLQDVVPEKIEDIAKAMGLTEGADVADAIAKLTFKVGLPTNLGALGIKENMLDTASEEAEVAFFGRSIARRGTAADYRKLLSQAL